MFYFHIFQIYIFVYVGKKGSRLFCFCLCWLEVLEEEIKLIKCENKFLKARYFSGFDFVGRKFETGKLCCYHIVC